MLSEVKVAVKSGLWRKPAKQKSGGGKWAAASSETEEAGLLSAGDIEISRYVGGG